MHMAQCFRQAATHHMGLCQICVLQGGGALSYPLNIDKVASGDMSENVRDQVTRTLRDLRFSPNGRIRSYQKPYSNYFDSIPYPGGLGFLILSSLRGKTQRAHWAIFSVGKRHECQ
jgi:hypothetical protein